MLIAYLDEFGHVGPYVADGHPKFGQHPVFGYGGFVIPASNARAMGAEFKRVKTSLFRTEIDKSSTPAQWERKGNEYFSTGSVTARPELIRSFRGIVRQLRAAGGQLFYYGDEKPRGTVAQTKRTAIDTTRDALRETINRIASHAQYVNDDVLLLTDAITDKTRQELAAGMYAHIFGRKREEMQRVVEAPLHIESKLNSGIQLADWICGLLGRASHFQLVKGSPFAWAANELRDAVQGGFTYESKLHLLFGDEIHHSELFALTSSRNRPLPAGANSGRVANIEQVHRATLRRRTQST